MVTEVEEIVRPEFAKDYLGSLTELGNENGIVSSWGFPLTKHLGDELWSKLSLLGSIEVINRETYPVKWAFIAKQRTPEEKQSLALERFGEVTRVGFGPRGGFKWVEYGNDGGIFNGHEGTRFYSRDYLPEDIDYKTDPRAVQADY